MKTRGTTRPEGIFGRPKGGRSPVFSRRAFQSPIFEQYLLNKAQKSIRLQPHILTTDPPEARIHKAQVVPKLDMLRPDPPLISLQLCDVISRRSYKLWQNSISVDIAKFINSLHIKFYKSENSFCNVLCAAKNYFVFLCLMPNGNITICYLA